MYTWANTYLVTLLLKMLNQQVKTEGLAKTTGRIKVENTCLWWVPSGVAGYSLEYNIDHLCLLWVEGAEIWGIFLGLGLNDVIWITLGKGETHECTGCAVLYQHSIDVMEGHVNSCVRRMVAHKVLYHGISVGVEEGHHIRWLAESTDGGKHATQLSGHPKPSRLSQSSVILSVILKEMEHQACFPEGLGNNTVDSTEVLEAGCTWNMQKK